MNNDGPEFPFPEDALGVVDRTAENFEYFEDADSTRNTDERVLARLGGTLEQPIIELTPGLDEETLERVRREVAKCLDPHSSRTYFGVKDGHGGVVREWRMCLEATCGMTWNWYGRRHWRKLRGR